MKLEEKSNLGLARKRDDDEPEPDMNVIFREVLWITIPTVVVGLLSMGSELINTVLVGHTGHTKALAAVGLGNMMQNVCGFTILFGLESALDTLVSQSFGAGEHELMRHYLQRCRCILTLQLVWVVPLLYFSSDILVLMGQPKEVAVLSSLYNRATIPGLFPLFFATTIFKYYGNQRRPLPGLASTLFVTIGHIAYGSHLVLTMAEGNRGAGIANSITWWLLFFCAAGYISIQEYPNLCEALFVTRDAFRDWGGYLRIALPATLQRCTEAWFWELCCLSCGLLGELALAVHVSVVSFAAIVFMFSYGVQAATATLVGNAIGANLPRKAEKTLWFCVRWGCYQWCVIGSLIICFRHHIACAYTPDKEVQDWMAKLLVFYACSGFGHTTQTILLGGLRGMGMNTVGTVVYVMSFYGCMSPVGAYLGYTCKMGLYGFWVAFFIGTLVAALLFCWYAWNVDFAKVANEAVHRMQKEKQQIKTLKSS